MNVRDAQPEDFIAIEQIHAKMGMDYQLPDLGQPLFFVRKVTEDESGQVIGACFLKIAAECYLWLDPDLAPKAKMETMQQMQPEVFRAAWMNGIDDIEARIPETIEQRFHKRLRQLGWTPNREGWHPWTAGTHA
jgi:hypothetical protein